MIRSEKMIARDTITLMDRTMVFPGSIYWHVWGDGMNMNVSSEEYERSWASKVGTNALRKMVFEPAEYDPRTGSFVLRIRNV